VAAKSWIKTLKQTMQYEKIKKNKKMSNQNTLYLPPSIDQGVIKQDFKKVILCRISSKVNSGQKREKRTKLVLRLLIHNVIFLYFSINTFFHYFS